MEFSNVLTAFLLTLFAGLATGVGSFLAFFLKHTNTKALAISLGFSAGVMIYISFMEMIPSAHASLAKELGASLGHWVSIAAFFGGIFLIGIIDYLVPSYENPHEMHHIEEISEGDTATLPNYKRLLRTGLFTALILAIHNFPEGLATFAATLKDTKLGIYIAVAIAIHNIPEGIAVSIPIYYATKSKKKAFFYSFISGLAEPFGALVGYLILMPFLNETVFGILFAFISGIMIYISFDELLPAAHEYGEHHLSIYGLIAGMATMAVSLALFV